MMDKKEVPGYTTRNFLLTAINFARGHNTPLICHLLCDLSGRLYPTIFLTCGKPEAPKIIETIMIEKGCTIHLLRR